MHAHLDLFPGHLEGEDVSPRRVSSFLFLQLGAEKMLFITFDIVHDHARVDGASDYRLDPSHFVRHDKSMHVALEVVIHKRLWDPAPGRLLHVSPAVEADG